MKTNKGFTLLELAISIVIIGLLVTGVLAGKDLITAGDNTSIISEFEKYKKAYYSFEAAYGQYPGDFADAVGQLSAGNNGDGNGQIAGAAAGEEYYAWNHLGLARMVDGNYSGTTFGGLVSVGVNVPYARFSKNAGYRMLWVAAYLKNTIVLGSTGLANSGVITANTAFSVDGKLDDGVPTTGEVRGQNAGAVANTCYTGTAYLVQTTALVCYLQRTLP